MRQQQNTTETQHFFRDATAAKAIVSKGGVGRYGITIEHLTGATKHIGFVFGHRFSNGGVKRYDITTEHTLLLCVPLTFSFVLAFGFLLFSSN